MNLNEANAHGPGLYILTLKKREFMPSGGGFDVNRKNCKIGKAKILARRCADYARMFGPENAQFYPLFRVANLNNAELNNAEKYIKRRLGPKHMHGTEWLQDITPLEAIVEAILALHRENIQFTIFSRVSANRRFLAKITLRFD
jgi:hypothetical protein